jgi:GT2 family glycosyltransferase
VIGNTGALLMIKKPLFESLGMFNENYIGCFEDVELNLKCNILKYKNIISNKSVAYHYESQTRDDSNDKIEKIQKDYSEVLLPFIIQNISKLENKIFKIK